jgi:hypothetical protein
MSGVRGRYVNCKVELDHPLDLAEGTEVEIEIRAAGAERDAEAEAWSRLGMSRLQEEWDNPQDAIYDDWKKLYGIQGG